MRKFSIIFLVVILTLMLVSSFSMAMEKKGETIILKAACDHQEGYSTVEGLRLMAKLTDMWTNGRIKIDVYPGAVLGSEKESIEQTQMGVIDINRVSISPVISVYPKMAVFALPYIFASRPVISVYPKMAVFALPYIFASREHMWKVLEGEIGQSMLKEIEPTGFLGLAYMDSGARSFYTVKKPINSPADLKGMKIRTQKSSPADLKGMKIRTQKSPVMMDMVSAMGGKPVPMAFEEVYSSLQTGVIDGAENNPPSYYETSHYEVAKYYSLDGHAMVPEIVLMSVKTWNALSDADKQIIKMAAVAAQELQRKLWLKDEVSSMNIVKEAGCKVSTPEKGPFIEAVKPVYEKYASKYLDLIEQIQKLAK